MKELSNHTLLMNTFLCLANKNRDHNPILFNNQYIVDTIELQFNKLDGKKIHIDLALKNPKVNNLLLIECKDGRLQNGQCERYKTLEKKDLDNAGATTLSENYTFEITYVGTKQKQEKLIEDIKNKKINFPILISDNKNMTLEYNEFQCNVLKEIFKKKEGIKLPEPIPVFYYPFGSNDSPIHILSYIGPTLIKFNNSSFNIDDILKETHNLFNYISEESLGDLRAKLKKILKELSYEKEINPFFGAPPKEKDFRLLHFNVSTFNNKLNEYISKLEKATTQLSLSDF